MYAGCYVNAAISIWIQNNQFGKRVNSNLLALQFVKDGESFGGGGVKVNDVFDDISSEQAADAADDDFLS
jgi:predicted 2-oxoglutarate/Fe(II)-dependent dioxygenase YbiX